MIKGKVEIIKEYGTPQAEVIYSDNNMIVDGAGEIISFLMTLPPDGDQISSASALYDTSNYTIRAASFGKAPLHYYRNAHDSSGVAQYARTASGEVWVSATLVSGASSYTPANYLPDAPVPTDHYLVNFTNLLTSPNSPVEQEDTVLQYKDVSGFITSWGNNSTSIAHQIPSSLELLSSIAVGYSHVVSLNSSGVVSAWGGSNSYGQLNVPSSLPTCRAIGAANFNSFAISQTGNLYSWGNYSGGILSYPSTYSSGVSSIGGAANNSFVILKNNGTVSAWQSSAQSISQAPSSIQGSVVKLATNNNARHAVAILNDQTVSGWKLFSGNDYGQIDFTPEINRIATSATKLFNNISFTIPTSNYHNYIIQGSSLFGWGNVTYPTTTPTGITTPKKIAVNPGIFTVCLMNNGTVSAWGNAPLSFGVLEISSYGFTNIRDFDLAYGRLQLITSAGYVSSFGSSVSNPAITVPAALQGKVSSLSIHGSGVLYHTSTGYVSSYNYLGTQEPELSAVPAELQGSCVAISAHRKPSTIGFPRAIGLRSDGKPFQWGSYTYVPPTLSGVTKVCAGYTFSMALKSNGYVSAWNNGFDLSCPTDLQGSCIDIAIADYTAYGLRSDGQIFKWQDTSHPINNIPNTIIYADPPSGVIDVAVGTFHTVVLKSDGTASGYGRNLYGEADIPPTIQGRIRKVIAQGYQTYVILDDGRAYGWGSQVGNLGSVLNIPNVPAGKKFTDLGIILGANVVAVGTYASSVPYYATVDSGDDEDSEDNSSTLSSKNYRQNVNIIPFKNTIINKVSVLGQSVDIVPSTIGALLDGAYPPSGGITVRIVSGVEPYTTVVSASLSGTFNTVGSMDYRGYINAVSGADATKGLIFAASNPAISASSNGTIAYRITIKGHDAALANLYGGITQMGLWSYDVPYNLNSGFNPPYTFRRYPEETGTYVEPLKYKLFAKKVFNENIVKIKDFGSAGIKTHPDLTITWWLYFV